MRGYDVLSALRQISYERHIPLDRLFKVLEEAITNAYKKKYGVAPTIIIKSEGKDKLKIFIKKRVIKGRPNSPLEISLRELSRLRISAEPGQEVEVELQIDEFGRIAVQTARQTMLAKLKDLEFQMALEEFEGKIGEIVTGTIKKVDRRDDRYIWVDLGKAEGILPKEAQVKRDIYKPNRRMKFLLVSLKQNPQRRYILPILSRSHPNLVLKLLEMEIPEIRDGLIQIVAIARIPGYKSKVAVKALNPAVDPVYVCVGPKGYRVQPITSELSGERIEVLPYSDDPQTFITKAFLPAKVTKVELFEEQKLAIVTVPDEQLALAIGRDGGNARLVANLTGWKINLKSESQYRKNEETEVFEAQPTSKEQTVDISDGDIIMLTKGRRRR